MFLSVLANAANAASIGMKDAPLSSVLRRWTSRSWKKVKGGTTGARCGQDLAHHQ
jgi:hypothetical protein